MGISALLCIEHPQQKGIVDHLRTVAAFAGGYVVGYAGFQLLPVCLSVVYFHAAYRFHIGVETGLIFQAQCIMHCACSCVT